MHAILQKLVQWIVVPVLTFFVEKIARKIHDYFAHRKKIEQSEQSNQATLDKLEAALFPQDKKEAAEDAIKKF